MKYIVLKWMQAHVLLHYSAVAWLPPSSHVFSGRSRIIASGYGNTRRPLVPGSAPVDKSIAASSSSDSSISSNFNKYYDPSTSFDFEAAAAYQPSMVPGKLRVVCVSDTHGFENRLGPIPDGDVLVHCGDFAPNRVRRSRGPGGNSPPDFATWILSQPHRFKIVVRGNHDPTRLPLAAANALFAYKPTLVTIANVTFSLAPYPTNKHKSIKSLSAHSEVTPGTVLVSHVPPYGVLDACVQDGKLIGDRQLRRKVHEWAVVDNAAAALAAATTAAAANVDDNCDASVANPAGQEGEERRRRRGRQDLSCPSVWLCGHVHEGYGAKPVNFATPLPENSMRKASNRSSKNKAPLKANSSKANALAAKSRAMAAIAAASTDHSAVADLANPSLHSEASSSSSTESPPLLPLSPNMAAAASTITLCLNVAVANDGRATSIEAGRLPVVFTVDTDTHEVELAEV